MFATDGPLSTNDVTAERSATRLFVGCLFVFLTVHLVLRLAVSPSLHPDDADLIVFDQSLAWGYHPQPPLYSWLLRVFTMVFGAGIVSLTLLRTALLAALAGVSYAAVAEATSNRRLAALAGASALLIPMAAWHLTTYLTHTLLMSVACVATLHAAIRIARRGRTADYVYLGVACAAGLLGKYTFALFGLALVGSAVTIPELRPRVLCGRMILAIGVCLLLFLPHGLWLLANWTTMGTVYAGTMEIGTEAAWPAGLKALYINLILLAAPTLAMFAAAFPRTLRSVETRSGFDKLVERWGWRYFAAVAIVFTITVVAANSGRLHERWLEPFFLLLPLVLLMRLNRVPGAERNYWKLGGMMVCLAAAVTIARGVQFWAGHSHRCPITMDYSFSEAARELQQRYGDRAVLVASDRGLGGNLRHHLPELPCVCADHFAYQPEWAKKASRYVLVWPECDGGASPLPLAEYATSRLGVELQHAGEVQTLTIPPLTEGHSPIRLCIQDVSRRVL